MSICCVKSCRNREGFQKQKGISFHSIPARRLHKWLNVLKICPDDYNSSYRVCSIHFEEHCINRTLGQRRLKEHAIPTLNLMNDEEAENISVVPALKVQKVYFQLPTGSLTHCPEENTNTQSMNSEFSTTEDHPGNQSNLQSQDGFAFVECPKSVPEVEFVDTRVNSEPFYYFNDGSDNFDTGKCNIEIKHEQEIEIEETRVKNEPYDSTYGDGFPLIDATNSSTSEMRIEEENSENVDVKSTPKCHTCNVCEYATTTSNKLKMHMGTHAGEKLFNCTMCQCTGLSRVKLKEHMKTHTMDTRLYKCRLCDYASTRSRSVKIHMRTHKMEKSYKCSLCEYAAALPGQLRAHTQTHLGVKRYACTLCKQSYTQCRDLKVHIILMHREKIPSGSCGSLG